MHKNTCGLGLFISNILCLLIERREDDKKKGLIVYSEVGVGTCFSFSFRCDQNSESSENNDRGKAAYRTNSFEKKEIKTLSISSSEFIVEKGCFPFKEGKHIFCSRKDKEDRRSPDQSKSRAFTLRPAQTFFEETRNYNYLQKDSINTLPPSVNSLTNIWDSSTFAQSDCNCTKVLIVDDGPFNIEACSRLLAKMKISFDTASNGLEAVEKITNLLTKSEICCSSNNELLNEKLFVTSSCKEIIKERRFCNKCKFYKLILMDVDMPIKNGIEATEEILLLLKKLEISVNIVGLSAFDQKEIVNRSMEAGMVEFITKPMKHSKLKEIISKYLLTKI